ncbi:MAG: class I SAM-dependent methyltransferase [Planctomycetota bacterium]|jgi:hypothetical protein
MHDKHKIDADDFKRMFRLEDKDLGTEFRDRLSGMQTTYRPPTQSELEDYILDILSTIHSDRKARGEDENQQAFEQGWQENLEHARKEGVSVEALRPRYFRQNKYFRYNKSLVVTDNLALEYDLFYLARLLIFAKYLKPYQSIYEFGCGSCGNLLMLSEMFADKRLYGLDWAPASVAIAELLEKEKDGRISGMLFDFLNPRKDIKLEPNSAVLTVHALEQLGDRHDTWLAFLLDAKPGVVVNYEPIIEFYDTGNLYDFLAIQYSQKRGYLKEYYTALLEMEKEGRIEILDSYRPYLGGIVHEASIIVWRPIK